MDQRAEIANALLDAVAAWDTRAPDAKNMNAVELALAGLNQAGGVAVEPDANGRIVVDPSLLVSVAVNLLAAATRNVAAARGADRLDFVAELRGIYDAEAR